MLTQGEYQNMNDMIRGILLNNQYKIITLDFDERIQRKQTLALRNVALCQGTAARRACFRQRRGFPRRR